MKKAQAKQGKVYVGKLKAELSDEEIKTHFEQFGQIAQVGPFSSDFLCLMTSNFDVIFYSFNLFRSSNPLTRQKMKGKISVSLLLRRRTLQSSY